MLERRIVLFVLIAIINSLSSLSYAQETNSSNYPALIRPGVYAGNGRMLSYADYFLPLQSHENKVYFMNFKALFGNHGDSEQNAGLGYRRLSVNEDVIWGVNGFYDARFTLNNNYVQQAGFGFERLTQSIDFRANVYLPTTDKKLISSSDTYSFGSTSVIKTTNQIFEEPLKGFDAEMGFLIPKLSDYVETRIFVGGYYYFSEISKNIPGWRVRLEASPSPALTFELAVKDDRTISTDYFAGAYVTLPLDMGNLFHGKNPFQGWRDYLKWRQGTRSMRDRMSDRIVRDIDITAKNNSRVTETNAVERLVYVDNTNGSGVENGTKEHPYNTLTEGINAVTAGAGDWVFVAHGDGTATGYTGNYTLKNSMTLWGEGYQAFPGLGGGSLPVLKGTGNTGTIITAGSNNTIQGLKFQNAIDGILGTSTGTLTVRNNTFTALAGNVDDAFAIGAETLSAGTMTVLIKNNTISNITKSGGADDAYGILLLPVTDNSIINATINNNSIQNTQSYGMNLATFGANSTLTLSASGNTIKSQEVGVLVTNTSGSGIFTMDFGGGSLGAAGRNSIFSNTTTDINNNVGLLSFKAKNNYWGGGAGTFLGTVDGSPFLTSDPN